MVFRKSPAFGENRWGGGVRLDTRSGRDMQSGVLRVGYLFVTIPPGELQKMAAESAGGRIHGLWVLTGEGSARHDSP